MSGPVQSQNQVTANFAVRQGDLPAIENLTSVRPTTPEGVKVADIMRQCFIKAIVDTEEGVRTLIDGATRSVESYVVGRDLGSVTEEQ